MKNVLITGAAGFIGFHLVKILLQDDLNIVGVDNINDYYDVELKYSRLEELGVVKSEAQVFNNEVNSSLFNKFSFVRLDISSMNELEALFNDTQFDIVINLAAQAGVRYSISNPFSYVQSNLVGFVNILECCRHHGVKDLYYASSSSVYGGNDKVPFSEDDKVDNPVSLYAATKKSNELMAHTYSHLYGFNTTGLRFFTVYGPWGRPDMAPMLFAKQIFSNGKINVFNNGDMSRDFTYVLDIVGSIRKLISQTAESKYRVFNIGSSSPVRLLDFIERLEKFSGKVVEKEYLPMQDGDVYQTYADTTKLKNVIGTCSFTSFDDGIKSFVEWYKAYYSCS